MISNVKEYENYYVSQDGIVINIKTKRKLKYQTDKNGYFRVNLYNKENKTKQFVHRLVAMAYLENDYNLPQVNHKDGNKQNNNVDNLEWCSAKENVNHAFRTGLKKGVGACHIGELNTKNKLKESDVLNIRKRKKQNEKIRDVFQDYKTKITYKGFEQIWYNFTWKHLAEKVGE